MSKLFGGNERKQSKKTTPAASDFAKRVLASIGGSCVYIEPKKGISPFETGEMK